MKRWIAFAVALVMMCGCVTAFAEYVNVPVWAQSSGEFTAAESLGIVPEVLKTADMSGSITRREFCSIAVNIFDIISNCHVENENWFSPFPDVDDPYVNAAYILGIVNGYPDGTFLPENRITRQEMFKMMNNLLLCFGAAPETDETTADALLSPFADGDALQQWARSSTVTAIRLGITNGDIVNGVTMLNLGADTTRAQAVVMAYRLTQTGIFIPVSAYTPGDGNDEEQESSTPLPDGVLTPGTALTTWGRDADTNAKMEFIFGSGGKYTTESEARSHMVEIEVPVWRLNSDGSKTPSKMNLEVHEKLAPTVLQIFTEIFNGPERFPIKNVGGYSWRGDGTSEHNWGLAIDINWEENYYVSLKNGSTSGNYWLPGSDPYSIPENGDVVNTFHKYGFGWGGDGWWSSVRDYMHFSFMST